MGIELTEDDKLWRDQFVPKVSDRDLKKIIEVWGRIGDHNIELLKELSSSQQYGFAGSGSDPSLKMTDKDTQVQGKEKKKDQKIAEIVYKYSNKGRDQLREAAIMEGKPQFIKLDYDKVKNQYFIKPEPKIDEMKIRVLRPPSIEECPFDPYEFRTIAEAQDYLVRAMKETPDTILQKIKIQIKNFNDIDDYTATLLGASIFGSYFQDRFSTVYYILMVGANGTGKTCIGSFLTDPYDNTDKIVDSVNSFMNH